MLPSRDCHEAAKNVANAQFWLHYLALTTSLSHLVQYAVYDILAKVTIAPYYPPPPNFRECYRSSLQIFSPQRDNIWKLAATRQGIKPFGLTTLSRCWDVASAQLWSLSYLIRRQPWTISSPQPEIILLSFRTCLERTTFKGCSPFQLWLLYFNGKNWLFPLFLCGNITLCKTIYYLC